MHILIDEGIELRVLRSAVASTITRPQVCLQTQDLQMLQLHKKAIYEY